MVYLSIDVCDTKKLPNNHTKNISFLYFYYNNMQISVKNHG